MSSDEARPEPRFRPWRPSDEVACLALFEANCPATFAPNERDEYAAFLRAGPDDYRVCELDGRVVGAFGLVSEGAAHMSLRWILLDPSVQGRGLGAAMMGQVAAAAGAHTRVSIAASQHSAPFFAHFGAVLERRTDDGWGPGMHRLDMRWVPGARRA